MTAVAVIQHNNTLRKILVDLVNSQAQFRCVCACSSSTEAVTELPKHRPHIALMDIHLPDQSGIVCTARLTEDLPHLQVSKIPPRTKSSAPSPKRGTAARP
jgi:DNA-binding NarL/FixJ family response regulator